MNFLELRGLWAFFLFFTSNVEREGAAFNFPDASKRLRKLLIY